MEKLQVLGKAYPWKRPILCPSCRGVRLWGHGFVLRFFQGFPSGLWIKRWRCADCTQVHTIRPIGWQSGLLHHLSIIKNAMLHRIRKGRYCPSFARRQTQQYWWKNLRRWGHSQSLNLCNALLERHVAEDFPLGVGRIFGHRLIPFYAGGTTYLPFALSTTVPFG